MAELYSFLEKAKTIAVVGISEREDRASRYVAEYLQRAGYTIYPVNPNIDSWNGLNAYDSVSDIPAPTGVDIVDVFRRPEFILPVAEDAVALTSVGSDPHACAPPVCAVLASSRQTPLST